MSAALVTVLISAGTAAVVGTAGALLVAAMARRSVAAAAVVAPLVVVASVAVGVLVSAEAMFLSAHDLTVVLLILAAAVPVALTFGILLARQVHAVDRRALQVAADRAREAEIEASRRELIAWVSHDLRTPLAGIRAMAESMEDGVVTDPARYFPRIRAEADRMAVMVDNLLAASRLQSGTLRLNRVKASIAELVSDTLASAAPLAAARSIRLTGRAAGPVKADVDTRELSRALLNLVLNAIKYTRTGGSVTVEAHNGDGVAVISVSDRCGGIPESDLPRVFDPGWRGTGARTPGEGEGAGLGLAIVRGVVRAHGGEAYVANVDGGCKFDIRLPQTTAGG